MLGAWRGWGFLPPARVPLPNIDARGETGAGAATTAQTAAAVELRARLPAARVDFDAVTGGPTMVSAVNGLLTGAQGQGPAITPAALASVAADDPHRVTKAFLAQHSKLFGFGPEALDRARIRREFVGAHNGLRTVVWEQQVGGIPIFEGVLISHTTKDGALVKLSSKFVRDTAQTVSRSAPNQSATAAPALTATQASALAARNVGEDATAEAVTPAGEPAASPEKSQKFKAAFLLGEGEAKLTWLPVDGGKLRLCWDVILTSRARGEMFRVLVDGQSGEVLVRHCLTQYISDATYNVFTSDSPSPFSPSYSTPQSNQPPLVSRAPVTLSALNTNASPNGWIDDGGNETVGNNVDAHADWNNDNLPDLPRPQGSPFRVFDFPLAVAAQDPTNYVQAATVQLFYWNNWMHDKLYELGFTEAAGNFQSDNFGRGGRGGDAVQADAQDGGGIDNANFSTPPDGAPGRMQMYNFTGPRPRRDGGLDAEVVLHEYTHGLSNRRVGGGTGISALQAQGMGEGWSDFYALSLLSEPGDNVNGCYACGAYVSYLISAGFTTNYYFGIRRYPYTTDMTKNPLTFKDIDPVQASAHGGIPRSRAIGTTATEVHNMGEVWCVTLWDARANLINKLGYVAGNHLILQLVTDGMNLSPANPNFLQARDAIVQADLVDNGGTNRAELWAAFAKRGMGLSATSPASATTTGLVEAYDLPDPLLITPAAGLSATGPVGGPFTPNPAYFTLTNMGASAVSWTLVNTSAWLTVAPSSGTVTPGGEAASVSVTVGSAANGFASGTYPVTIGFTNQATGLGQSRGFTLSVLGRSLSDGFDPAIDLSQWSSFGGVLGSTVIATNYGGCISAPNSLWFGGAGSRFATTRPINTTSGGPISFSLRLANGSGSPWENVDIPAEGVVLEFSTDGGATFAVAGTYDTSTCYNWTSITLPIPPAAQSPATQFRWRQLSNSGTGYDHWALDNVTVDAEQTLTGLVPPGQALDAPGLVWSTSGSVAWASESSVNHDGIAAAQSGLITDNQSSSVQTTVTGPGTLSFWWKVSSEEWFDCLAFYVDGLKQAAISGEVDWQEQTFAVDNGSHTLAWTYAKDPTVRAGADAAWLDQVTFTTNPPAITLQPLSQQGAMGALMSLSVAASGAPPITYQWSKDGANLSGATATSYIISPATRRDSGVYRVVATNPGGGTPSSNATLHVRSPQKLGPPTWLPGGLITLTAADADGGPLLPGDLPDFQAQATTNFVDWDELLNSLTVSNGMLLLVDPGSTNHSRRFYRIHEP